jgi:hypothetical protein
MVVAQAGAQARGDRYGQSVYSAFGERELGFRCRAGTVQARSDGVSEQA